MSRKEGFLIEPPVSWCAVEDDMDIEYNFGIRSGGKVLRFRELESGEIEREDNNDGFLESSLWDAYEDDSNWEY